MWEKTYILVVGTLVFCSIKFHIALLQVLMSWCGFCDPLIFPSICVFSALVNKGCNCSQVFMKLAQIVYFMNSSNNMDFVKNQSISKGKVFILKQAFNASGMIQALKFLTWDDKYHTPMLYYALHIFHFHSLRQT